jgi:dTDP-glucose 4,6-dehydratase
MPGSKARPLPAEDLEHILEHASGAWEALRGGRLLVTGASGFFGRWMVESFLRANEALVLGATAVVLTRDAARFREGAPHVAGDPAISVHEGDVRSFDQTGSSHVLHLATEAGPSLTPVESFRTAIAGTESVLASAAAGGANRLLFTSSGAVYGPQPPDCERISEDYTGAPAPDDPRAGYGHGKRAAEFLCATAAESGLDVTVARPFALVGPLLPLDANFAIGNFIRDALSGQQITISGDGTPRRSYLYAADLAVWLWTILVQGIPGRSYNVGSEDDLSIGELADRVANVVRPGLRVRIASAPTADVPPSRYVPSTARARQELGLRVLIGVDAAIERTARWYST